MRYLFWMLRAAVFFSLFAFALNNQHEAHLKWFFSQEWRTSMVFIVLAAFALGCVFGVLAMVPSWWQHRRAARQQHLATPAALPATAAGHDGMAASVPANGTASFDSSSPSTQ